MRNTIKRILREQVSDRFLDSVSKRLDDMNALHADQFGVDYQTWRLGSELLYKTQDYRSTSWCVLWGSPEQKILIDKMSMISDISDFPKKEVEVYCDIISRYYNLDTPIPKDNNSIIALLSRKYYVTILDGDHYQYHETYGSDDGVVHIGYEYNDYDDENEVGEGEGDVIWFLKGWFQMNESDAKDILYKWTYNRIENGNFNG